MGIIANAITILDPLLVSVIRTITGVQLSEAPLAALALWLRRGNDGAGTRFHEVDAPMAAHFLEDETPSGIAGKDWMGASVNTKLPQEYWYPTSTDVLFGNDD